MEHANQGFLLYHWSIGISLSYGTPPFYVPIRSSLYTRNTSSLRLIRAQLILPPTAHFPSTLLPFDSAPQTHLLIPDELPNHPSPTFVVRQIRIEILCYLMQSWQSCPRDSWEIMMLIMQPHIVGEHIQWPVVGKRLRHRHQTAGVLRALGLLVEHVMLRNEVSSTRVQ